MTKTNQLEKPCRGPNMEGFVARWYSSLTGKSMHQYSALASQVAEGLPPGSRVLEIAPGPGYLAVELARLGPYRITGLDISHTFVEIARANAASANLELEFLQGDAAVMPFENDQFDFALCRAAFKNFGNPQGALNEIHRVLKPGGSALIIDMRRDAPRESINKEVDGLNLDWVNATLTRLTFRHMLLQRAYTEGEFRQFIERAGFDPPRILETLTGLEIHMVK